MGTRSIAVLLALTALSVAEPAVAYVGPGAGLSLVGAFLGLLVAVLAAVGFVVLWPIRRMLRRRAASSAQKAEPSQETRQV